MCEIQKIDEFIPSMPVGISAIFCQIFERIFATNIVLVSPKVVLEIGFWSHCKKDHIAISEAFESVVFLTLLVQRKS